MEHQNNIHNYANFFRYSFLTLLPLLVISMLILTLSHASADNSSADNIVLSVPSSCTLNAIVDAEHSLSTIGGTYTENIGTTTMKTICNDANGFSVYTIGSSNNLEGNTSLISNISSTYDIATGTATSGNISNWAMKLTPVSGPYTPVMAAGYDSQYVPIPSTWTKVAHRPANTDTSADSSVAGSSLTTTYAAYISSAQPAGTYTGQVKYVLLHPNTSANFMTLEMAFDRYVGPEHKITLDGSTTGTKYYRMQDMTSEICQAATTMGGGAQMQLIDDRINLDGNKRIYWVAKLADGNCWMTQNLDLDLIAGHTYTHADTDLGWSAGSFDANANWTFSDAPSTIAANPSSGTFPGWTYNASLPYSANPGGKYFYTSNANSNDLVYNSLSECINAGHTDCEHYHAGNYYNLSAVTAGKGIGNNSSICPANWRLPSNSNRDFYYLLSSYNIITDYGTNGFINIRRSPLYFVRSGILRSGNSIPQSATEGVIWTGNNVYVGNAYILRFNQTVINPEEAGYIGNNDGAYGMSARCLAR